MWRPSSPALTGVRGARLISVEQVPSCLISSSSLSLLWGRGGGRVKQLLPLPLSQPAASLEPQPGAEASIPGGTPGEPGGSHELLLKKGLPAPSLGAGFSRRSSRGFAALAEKLWMQVAQRGVR